VVIALDPKPIIQKTNKRFSRKSSKRAFTVVKDVVCVSDIEVKVEETEQTTEGKDHVGNRDAKLRKEIVLPSDDNDSVDNKAMRFVNIIFFKSCFTFNVDNCHLLFHTLFLLVFFSIGNLHAQVV